MSFFEGRFRRESIQIVLGAHVARSATNALRSFNQGRIDRDRVSIVFPSSHLLTLLDSSLISILNFDVNLNFLTHLLRRKIFSTCKTEIYGTHFVIQNNARGILERSYIYVCRKNIICVKENEKEVAADEVYLGANSRCDKTLNIRVPDYTQI